MAENGQLNVFVTSGSDALGRELTRQLVKSGHRVTSIASGLDEATQIREDGGLPVYSDLFRAGEIAGTLRMIEADAIVNTAPQVMNSLPPYQPDWGYYQRLLSEGTSALLEAASATGVKFLVQTSFTFLYGDQHGAAVDEQARLSTEDALFRAAAQAEKAVLNSGTPACVLRAGFNYGAGTGVMHALRDGVRAGALPLGDDHQLVSWVHVADLAAAIVRALEVQPAGEIFNIADETPAAPGTFADYFADEYGVKRPGRQRLPQMLAQVMQPASHRALLAVSAVAKTDKARAALGWQPQTTSFHQGIQQALLAWRAHS